MLTLYKDKKKKANCEAKFSTISILKDEIDKNRFEKKNHNKNSKRKKKKKKTPWITNFCWVNSSFPHFL